MYYNKVFWGIGLDSISSNVAYQTINSLIRHLFIYDPVYSPYAILNLNNYLVDGLVFTVSLIILGLVIYKTQKQNFIELYIVAISLNVILAPIAEEYHYILFIPLIFILGRFFYNNIKEMKIELICFSLCVIGLALPIGYKTLQYSNFPYYLLAYPKLYCGVILIVIYKIISRKKYIFNTSL